MTRTELRDALTGLYNHTDDPRLIEEIRKVVEKLASAVEGEPITARYTNWRGERAERTFVPHRVFFGSNEWHPEPQVLIEATDCEKDALRTFAAAGFAHPAPATADTGDYDRGRRDILNAILALNPAVAAKIAYWEEREPDPEGRLPFNVALWVTEVATQLGIEPRDAALSAPSTEAGA